MVVNLHVVKKCSRSKLQNLLKNISFCIILPYFYLRILPFFWVFRAKFAVEKVVPEFQKGARARVPTAPCPE